MYVHDRQLSTPIHEAGQQRQPPPSHSSPFTAGKWRAALRSRRWRRCAGSARARPPARARKAPCTPTTASRPAATITATGIVRAAYAALQSAGELWKCPSGAKTSSSTWPTCVAGSGPNPLCAGELNASRSCCCPLAGCYAEPKFNTIVGVCKGGLRVRLEQDAGAELRAGGRRRLVLEPRAEGVHGPGGAVLLWPGRLAARALLRGGHQAEINYLAAFEFDKSAQVWRRQDESSFNTDGKRPAYDLMKPQGGLGDDAWLAPQPGGSVFWSLGYYAAGVKGVGGDAMMFVLSTERWWGGTWYMLNQIELDRGPAAGYPADGCATTNNNCWAAGNAGEMDFLEPAWQSGKASDVAVTSNYTASYSTQNNQVGRQFVGGVNSGGFASENYLLTAPPGSEAEPVVYVAVVDSVGNWVYRVPASRAAKSGRGSSARASRPPCRRRRRSGRRRPTRARASTASCSPPTARRKTRRRRRRRAARTTATRASAATGWRASSTRSSRSCRATRARRTSAAARRCRGARRWWV